MTTCRRSYFPWMNEPAGELMVYSGAVFFSLAVIGRIMYENFVPGQIWHIFQWIFDEKLKVAFYLCHTFTHYSLDASMKYIFFLNSIPIEIFVWLKYPWSLREAFLEKLKNCSQKCEKLSQTSMQLSVGILYSTTIYHTNPTRINNI